MPYYSLYRASAEMYLWASAFVSPILCVLGWLLFGRAISKRLQPYVYWLLPFMIGSSLTAIALLLTAFLGATHSRNYALGCIIYLLPLAGLPFHVVWLVRLWKTITALPPSAREQPPQTVSTEQDESVWPPQPRRER